MFTVIMKVVSVILIISVVIVVYSYFSRVLHNDIEERELVYHTNRANDEVVIQDQAENLFWLVQVSDIHVSKYRDLARAPDLLSFCETHLSVIKPDLVIASGDLTDAKFYDMKGSKQYLEEWKTYHETVKKCRNIVETWLDIRGNHDAFDTPDFDHQRNLFRHYSVQGGAHPSTYLYHHYKPFGRYSFIAVDASPNPGPKRPFNFFGYIKQTEEDTILKYVEESKDSNLTFGFGHYPTSLIATESGTNVRQLFRNLTAYFCGHLHTLAGRVTEMYARHRSGSLELEVGDWKDNRLYRVIAVDHDILSFSDQQFNSWPVVVVTNPKRAALGAPIHEPIHRTTNSTHIRLLIFTPGTVSNAELFIDEVYIGRPTQSKGPLFVLAWNPNNYLSGVHTLRLKVQDSLGNRLDHSHEFSLDGTSPLFALSGRFILMMNLASCVQFLYFFLVFCYAAVLVALRRCDNIKSNYLSVHQRMLNCIAHRFNTWLYRVWLVSKTPQLYTCLLVFLAYITIGPWFVGELLEGHLGTVFVWGMYVQWTYLPGFLTYAYGTFQLMMFNIPILMYLGYVLHYKQMSSKKQTVMHQVRHIYLPFFILVGITCFLAWSEFPTAYGTRALIIGPVRTGSVILSVYLFYVAKNTRLTTSIGTNSIRLDIKQNTA